MIDPIVESGMKFSITDAGKFFYIEKSSLYRDIGDGVKISEFAVIKELRSTKSVWLVEAKSSTPRAETQPNFDEFISEVVQKMSNTIQLLIAALLQRHSDQELSADFKSLKLQSLAFKCVLVINGHQDAWLPPLQDALLKALTPLIKTMALGPNSVAVLNDRIAREQGLII